MCQVKNFGLKFRLDIFFQNTKKFQLFSSIKLKFLDQKFQRWRIFCKNMLLQGFKFQFELQYWSFTKEGRECPEVWSINGARALQK